MLPYKHNKLLVPNAKSLRKNMTKEERHLWYDFLRTHPARFTRQKVLGQYIVDFYSAKAQLVIELDGSQHFDPDNAAKDAQRTLFLEQYGVKVIRIPNVDINRNFQAVCDYIDNIVTSQISEELTQPKEPPC